ncbi:unnamed protein product [Mytilus edulis]|uniref:Uncharacterized protein n=1 Tax=Mytilus edulis TaxID=6550 RepID=A0A8S3VFV5_MYTED|nr:unnamed protein product [Mytilus edulis]
MLCVTVETEKIERMRRLLQAVDIKHKEIDPNSKQSKALSKKEEKRNVQKLDRSEDHSKDTERRQNKPHQSNRPSIKRDEKKNEQEKTTLEYLNSSAAPKSNPDKEKLNIDDKENTPKPREKDTLTPKQIHDESSLSSVNHNFKNTDDITDAMISEMDTIILDAKNQKELMTSEGLVKCGIWDFADITEDIKSFKQDEEFNSIEDYIDFWFDCIHCFCKDGSDHTDQLCPPVLMVCTGTDKVEKVEERKGAFNEQFDSIFHDQAKVNHRRGIYFLSNKEDGHHEIKNLKDHISKIAKQMGYFAESLPTKWIHLENALAVLKGFNIDVYEWENMLKLAQKNSIEEDELLLFLNNQHKIGNIIFFNELKEYIILQPAVKKTEHPALYRGKAVFYLDRDKLSKFIICFSRNAISLQIWKWSDVDENMYKKVLNELCDRIESIRGTMGQNLSYYIKAKCQTADFAKRVGRIGYEDLLEKDLYMCEEHDDTHSKTDIINTWLKHDVSIE